METTGRNFADLVPSQEFSEGAVPTPRRPRPSGWEASANDEHNGQKASAPQDGLQAEVLTPRRPNSSGREAVVRPDDKESEDAPNEKVVTTAKTTMGFALDLSEQLKEFNEDHHIVEEPTNLLIFKSYEYTPTKADIMVGHPISPCAPTHKRWLNRLNTALAEVEKEPSKFEDLISVRRETLIKKSEKGNAAFVRFAGMGKNKNKVFQPIQQY